MLKQVPKVDGKGVYQIHKLRPAVALAKRRRCALDVGMHVGLWAMHLAKVFDKVIGFEPVQEHIECLHRNMDGIKNWEVHNVALGNRSATVGLKPLADSTGSTQINNDINEGIKMVPLDSFDFEAVDFIKVDVEGYEYFVIEGGEKTIRKHKPVIIIEQKGKGKAEGYGKERYAARNLLQSWGAKQNFEIGGDCCLTW